MPINKTATACLSLGRLKKAVLLGGAIAGLGLTTAVQAQDVEVPGNCRVPCD